MDDSDRPNRRGMSARAILLPSLAILASHGARAGGDCVPADPSAPICLSGTVLAPDYAAALVQQAGGTSLSRLRRGDPIGDWHVERIGPGYLMLSRDGRTLQVKLGTVGVPAAEPVPVPKPGIRQGPLRQPRVLSARGERQDR